MASPVQGDDNGVGYGVKGTSVPNIGVIGNAGKPYPINARPIGLKPVTAGVYGEHTQGGSGVIGTSSNGEGVTGNSGSAPGVHGHSLQSDGVLGDSTRATGVHGVSASGTGVRAQSTSGLAMFGTSTSNTAIVGEIGSLTTNQVGVWGAGNGSEANGTFGISVNGTGVYGQATTDESLLEAEEQMRGKSGLNYDPVGVWGYCDRGAGVRGVSDIGFAGQFFGNVQVTGSIQKASSNFCIDHPLDPANKLLLHAAVESSEMKNMYDGVATLNRKGEAEIRLPAWFQALNADFRYQLTAIGRPAPDLHISQPLRANRFRIAGGRPGMKVSWQITGIRQDRWAKANPLAVEQKKEGAHRGRYLHPKAFGKSPAKFGMHGQAGKRLPKRPANAEAAYAEAE